MKSGLAGIFTALTGLSVRAINQIVIMGVTLVAAHYLAPSDFGVFAIASACITLIRTLMYTGAFEYLLKAKLGEEAPTECLIINISLSIVLTAALMLFVPISARVFGTRAVGDMIVIMAPTNIMSAFSAWQESQLLRAKRVRLYYAVTAVAEIVAGIGAVALLAKHAGLGALVGQLYLRSVVMLFAYLLLQKLSWSGHIDRQRLVEIAKWSSSRYGSTVVSFMSGYGADFFLGAFLSPAATGIYRASSRVVTAAVDIFSHPTQILSATIFSRHAAEGKAPDTIWPQISGASAFLGWSALAGLAAISDRIVPIILGSQWTGTGIVIALLCVARAFSLVDAATVPLLVAFDRSGTIFKIQAWTAVGSVALLWAVSRFGVAAAAGSAIAISAITTTGYCLIAARLFPGSLNELRPTAAISILPALTLFLATKACLALVPQSLGAVPTTTLAVAAGILAWLLSVLFLRRAATTALHAFNA
jgi:O-antigen/teichoic acid export membrane protein